MSVRKIAKIIVLGLLLPMSAVPAFVSPVAVHAGGCWESWMSACFWGEMSGIPKPKGALSVGDGVIESGLKNKVIAVANRIIALAALAAIWGIVFAGFNMVSAFWDDDKLKKGKDALKWSVLGFALALVSFPLVNATINFFYSSGG